MRPIPSDPIMVTVVGGGTAGWMAACLMARHWGDAARVTVIESPEIGIIGVGEGSTPQLKAFFDRLGIAEADWMPQCDATYKCGIRFAGWSERLGFADYFHPFATALDPHTAPQFFFDTRARRTGRNVPAHPDRYFLPQLLARQSLAPVPADNFPFLIGYGYHFDATRVGAFLRDHAIRRLGVVHRPLTVAAVEVSATGDIANLVASDGERIGGDLFVDASGFRGLLVQKALGEPFLSFSDNLFNDAAVAIPTPRETGPLSCETRATALAAGWAWKIPLTGRNGNGYVYSSAHLSPTQAEAELRAHLGVSEAGEARHLTMRVGRTTRTSIGNCVAVGLSQSFIEPLEATALHIVQATVEGFCAAVDAGIDAARDGFNAAIAARIEGIRDYVVAHYRMNRRTDTDYWRANAANQRLSDDLKSVMTAWFTGADLEAEVIRLGISSCYAPMSWHCLLAGYGAFPDDAKLRAPEAGLPTTDLVGIDNFIARCALNFGDHAARIDALASAA